MSRPTCATPIPRGMLLGYWLGEIDGAREAELDRHLLACGACSGASGELVDLAEGVRTAVRSGAVHAVLTDGFVRRLAAEGLRLREYRAPQNGTIYCTVAPDDDLLITRLVAPLAGIERLDLERLADSSGVLERLRDVPFDPAAGAVVFASRVERIRALPATTVRMRLLAVDASGERLVGEYTFHHSPWPAGNPRCVGGVAVTQRRGRWVSRNAGRARAGGRQRLALGTPDRC